ncbi:hypothetical protein OX459_22920 [Janthinobacterium sp. SUN026]|nr:hypothetical protein [Janthinobacterium sp. SUN026]
MEAWLGMRIFINNIAIIHNDKESILTLSHLLYLLLREWRRRGSWLLQPEMGGRRWPLRGQRAARSAVIGRFGEGWAGTAQPFEFHRSVQTNKKASRRGGFFI